MNIEFTKEEVQFIMNVLGELPSKSGAYMLMVKIQQQINAQQPEGEQANG